jgi:hypothetical protein
VLVFDCIHAFVIPHAFIPRKPNRPQLPTGDRGLVISVLPDDQAQMSVQSVDALITQELNHPLFTIQAHTHPQAHKPI